jgi:hypothetical protein
MVIALQCSLNTVPNVESGLDNQALAEVQSMLLQGNSIRSSRNLIRNGHAIVKSIIGLCLTEANSTTTKLMKIIVDKNKKWVSMLPVQWNTQKPKLLDWNQQPCGTVLLTLSCCQEELNKERSVLQIRK